MVMKLIKHCPGLTASQPLFLRHDSLPPSQKIDYKATSYVWSGSSAVGEYLFIIAVGVLECVSEDRHGREITGVVHLVRKGYHGRCEPGGGEDDGAEGIAENAME